MKLRFWASLFAVLALAASAAAQTRISGTLKCGQPDKEQSIAVGDHPGHAFAITQSTCPWTKPVEIAGLQSKEDVYTGIAEIMGERVRERGFEVGTMSNGDKIYIRPSGVYFVKDGKLVSGKGRWHFTGGTGKLKGLKGKGTYTQAPQPDGSVLVEVEGEYQLPE